VVCASDPMQRSAAQHAALPALVKIPVFMVKRASIRMAN